MKNKGLNINITDKTNIRGLLDSMEIFELVLVLERNGYQVSHLKINEIHIVSDIWS